MFLRIGVLSALVALVTSLSSGGPKSSCGNLSPRHGVQAQSAGSLPYSITTSSATYSPGQKITVRVDKKLGSEGERNLAGYMLQGRKVGQSISVGFFSSVRQGKTRLCSRTADTVTHSNTNGHSFLTFTWQAPSDDQGSIEFIGTLSQSFGTFWTNVRSAPITFLDPTTGTTSGNGQMPKTTTTRQTPKTSTTTSATTPTTKSMSDDGSYSHEDSSDSSESYESGSNSSQKS